MYAEDQEVRHMLLKVPTGKAQVKKSTQSRFNTTNVKVTPQFVKEMVLKSINASAEYSHLNLLQHPVENVHNRGPRFSRGA